MPMRRASSQIRRRSEAGYTLMLVVFMVASMWIMATVVTMNIITEGKRQKEDEMIWRGNQYARAIGLYVRRFNGKFPTKIEDLTNQTNGVRFLRQAYKDPMNKEDGSWRFIYVGPNGILIGSNRQSTLIQGAVGGTGTAGGAPLGGILGQLQNSPQNTPGFGAPGVQGTQSGSSTSDAGSSSSQPQPLGGAVAGGNIIGVGSKIDKPSLKVYLGESNYKNWEFIWNPFGRAVPGQQPNNLNGAPGPNGAPNPAGGQPTTQPSAQ
jgi:hypothetical protein